MSRTGPKAHVVKMAGDLTIRGIGKAHTQLLAAVRKHPSVVVQIDEAAAVDLTLVQLIQSGRRSAHEAERRFELAAPAAGGLLEVLRRGGFAETNEQRSFWLKDGGEQS